MWSTKNSRINREFLATIKIFTECVVRNIYNTFEILYIKKNLMGDTYFPFLEAEFQNIMDEIPQRVLQITGAVLDRNHLSIF